MNRLLLMFPTKDALGEYEKRFRERGNNETYIDKVISSFNHRYQQFMENPHKKILLSKWENLEDALIKMKLKLIPKQ